MPDYLPPEPGGSEPDLGAAPPPPPPPPPAPPPPPQYAPVQPQQQWWQQPQVPDNGQAVSGFVLSMVAVGLLLISFGFSSVVSVVCAGLGIYYSQKGKERVARGETPKHASLAQAGFVSGIIALVLSILATLAWIVFIVLLASSEEFRRDFENDFESSTVILQSLAALLP